MIPMVFILVVALVAVVGSITFITSTGLKNIGQRTENQRSLFIAEAGMNKAIWYLTTPVEEGGMGIDWRTDGITEDFGGGSYTIKVQDDPDGIKITSISSYKGTDRTIEMLAGEDFSDAFTRHALLSDKDINLDEGTEIEGGTVAVTEGNEVTGAGATGDEQTTLEKPNVDTSYYDNQIAVAEGGGGSVVIGDQTYGNLDLNGVNLFVQGNVTINGTIYGQADLTATGNIIVGSSGIVGQRVKLIADNDLTINPGAKVRKNAVLYAGENLTIGNDVITADPAIYVTPKNLKVGQRSVLSGKFVGGLLNIGSNTHIEGNVIGGNYGTQNIVESSVTIVKKELDQDVPPGFTRKVKFKRWLRR